MDEKLSLARKVLNDNIFDRSFVCKRNGTIFCGCSDVVSVFLTKAELFYILKCEIHNEELFKNMNIKKFDLEKILGERDYIDPWTRIHIRVIPNNNIPIEVEDLENFIFNMDYDRDDAKNKLLELKDGIYTMNCSILVDNNFLSRDSNVKLFLTAEEVIKLLYENLYDCADLDYFNDIFHYGMNASELEDRLLIAAKKGLILSKYFSSEEAEEKDSLNFYIEGWTYLIFNILSGDIESKDIDSWLQYFEIFDKLEYAMSINVWYTFKYSFHLNPK